VAAGQLERDVEDHVLLAADDLAPSQLEQDVADVDTEALRRPLGVQQERAVDAGVAEQQPGALFSR
jgi:hypothetical protein